VRNAYLAVILVVSTFTANVSARGLTLQTPAAIPTPAAAATPAAATVPSAAPTATSTPTPAPSFTLSVGTKLISIPPAGPTDPQQQRATTTTVTVSCNKDFKGTVTLTATGAPPGVALNFARGGAIAQESQSAIETLTIAVGPSTLPGEYAIRIEAGDAATTNQVEIITLAVETKDGKKPWSFDLFVHKKLIPVETPTKTELTVNTSVIISPGDRFVEPVTLTATGAPPGVTVNFNGANKANIETASGAKIETLTIVIGTSVTAGDYPIQIDAVAQDASIPKRSAQIILAVGTGGNFDLMLGVGSLIVRGDVTDYKTNTQNNVLETTNLGRATPQLLTGAAFRLPFGNFGRRLSRRIGPRPWYAFLSLKFSPDSSQTFSGYVIGGSYKLSNAFSLLGGYALTPIQEPSPGFRGAAAQIVSQNPGVPIYQRFNVNDLQHNTLDAFDGFPLFVQSATGPTTTRLFAGDPTVVHYHGGFIIGVAIPISLKTQLGGK